MNEKLKDIIAEQGIDAEHMIFDKSCHSVEEAAEAAGVQPEDLIKSICMVSDDNKIIVAIVKGEDRASTKRVAKALDIERPRVAEPEEVENLTGFPAGGTPPFGFNAEFLMDERIFEKKIVLGGGGSSKSLIKMSPQEMKKANQAMITRIRK
ncbi:MAG: aminoacyl-tRNA deacylase [Candidatus Woesearchaeota archaeon]